MKNSKTKGKTPMEKLTNGYEKFIQGKKTNKNGKEAFDSTLKKTINPKQRGAK